MDFLILTFIFIVLGLLLKNQRTNFTLLLRIYRLLRVVEQPSSEATRFDFYVCLDDLIRKVKHMANMPTNKKLPLFIEPKDAEGRPARVVGTPEWRLDSEGLGTLDVAADGMTATFTSGNALGSLNVIAKGTTISGKVLEESLQIVIENEAVTLGLRAGEPQDI